MRTLQVTFALLLTLIAFTSCSKDEVTTQENGKDMAAEVEGLYMGTILSEDMLVIDTYEIMVKRISNNEIEVSGDGISTLKTEIRPEDNPEGLYYVSPWQVVEQYAVTYWLEKEELVVYMADGEVNFVGLKQ